MDPIVSTPFSVTEGGRAERQLVLEWMQYVSSLPGMGRLGCSLAVPSRPVNDTSISFFFYDLLVVKSPAFYDSLCAKIQELSAKAPGRAASFSAMLAEWKRVSTDCVSAFEDATKIQYGNQGANPYVDGSNPYADA